MSVHSALNDKSCELAIKTRQDFDREREVSGDGESGKTAQWVNHVSYKHKNQNSRLGGGTGHLLSQHSRSRARGSPEQAGYTEIPEQ